VETALLAGTVVLALVFAWTNGFHDTSNAVATSLATGALTPRVALGLAAVLNGVGSLLGVNLALFVSRQLVDAPVNHPGLGLVMAALIAAIGWNLVTWAAGMPSSSSHALLGGLAGAGVMAGVRVDWGMLATRVGLPMLASPLAGFVGAWLLTALLLVTFRSARHAAAVRGFRLAQTVSASAMAVGHGLQDGQKTMGVIVLALVAAGAQSNAEAVPLWVRLVSALALAAGTAAGGLRIVRTLARRVAPIDPVTGFAAESVAAAVLYVTAGVLNAPVSSTHAVTAAVLGAGSTRGGRRIRWRTVRRVVATWLATPIVTAVAAGVLYLPLSHLAG
jgi:inorganic phosphate transporter, PiT family